jgi:hypothetical protein
MRETINLTEAAHRCQVTAKTLALWLRKWAGEGLLTHTKEPLPIGSRVGGPGEWRIDAEELAALVQRYVPGRQRRATRASDEELRAEVAALKAAEVAREEEIAQLRAQIAALSRVTPAPAFPSTPQRHVEYMPPARPRPKAPTRPLRIEEAEAGPNQSGYPYTRWAQDHNLNVGTVQERVTGRDKRGKWQPPKMPLVNGKLDLAGQRALWEHYHTLPRFTSCSRCPHESSPALGSADIDEGATRPLPATVPMKRADSGSHYSG